MIPLSLRDVQILIAAAVFLMGSLCIIMGAIVLVTRGYSREVNAITAHTARASQKGVADDVAGLVTSTSELLTSLNQLIRTANGVGMFLISLGILMLVCGYWVVQQINWVM
jgi:hypothetical protein